MPIKVKMKFPKEAIIRTLSKELENKRNEIVQYLLYIGEQCVNDARLSGSYTDRTGNLRSSIGYRVIDNGVVVGQSGFTKTKDSDTGIQTGKEYIDTVAQKYASFSGLVMIVVAGMNYASYVADKGYNVLQSAEIVAENLVNQLIGGK